jgi:hypothetical protein
MIGLLDMTEHDRRMLRDIAMGRLVWYPTPPLVLGTNGRHSVWAWTDRGGQPLSIASLVLVDALYRLQRADLLTATYPGQPVEPTAAGARMIGFLNAPGWQPFDAIADVPVAHKAVSRPRRKRAS